MLSGKELIIATKKYAKENRFKSWLYTLSTLVLLIFLFIGSYWNYSIYLKLVCSILSVFTFSRMFVIYHDYLHHAILNKSILAKIIFYVFGLFSLAPTSIWKRSHDYHHKNNSKLFSASIGSYPIMNKEQFLKAEKKDRIHYLATRHPITIIFGYLTMFLYGMCIQSFIKNPRRHFDSLVAILLHILFGCVLFIYGGFSALILTLIIPYTLTFGFGAYLFYAQHNFPGVKFKNNIEWSYDHAALQSSSFMVMKPFMRWATANIGYHHIHHINSRIPFYRLPEAMSHFPELQKATTTSLKLKDIIACLKLKIWDPKQGKMLTLNEIFIEKIDTIDNLCSEIEDQIIPKSKTFTTH